MTIEMANFGHEQGRIPSNEQVIQGTIGRIQRKTLSLDSYKNDKELKKEIKRSAYAFTGQNIDNYNPEVWLVAPQLSYKNQEKFKIAKDALKEVYENAVFNAKNAGLINENKAEQILEENRVGDLWMLFPIQSHSEQKILSKNNSGSLNESKKTGSVSRLDLLPKHEYVLPKRNIKALKKSMNVVLIAGSALTACQTVPTASEIPSTSQSTGNEVSSHSEKTSIPAPIPTEEGKTVEINSSNYPTNPDNFILNDTRTNEEKMDILLSLAKEDVEKEIELYKEELKRMGKKESDFEFLASIVDGRSWVIVPREKARGKVYVPSIDGIIQSSLHLFGRLGEKGDFFDLIPVAIENATVVGDSSGWHVVAGVKEGRVSQWYDARYDMVETIVEPTPTPEERFTNLLPETLEECKEKNTIRPGHEYEDITTILVKEKRLGIDFRKIPEFSIGFPNYDSRLLKLPQVIGLHFETSNDEKISISSCSYIQFGNGNDAYVLGIPLRRFGSDQGVFLHFLIEPELAEKYFEIIGKPQIFSRNDINKNYPAYSQEHKTIIAGGINLILGRGGTERGGIWDNILNLIPDDDTDYRIKTGLLISDQTKHPETGEWVKLTLENERTFLDSVEKIIFPAVSIGFGFSVE